MDLTYLALSVRCMRTDMHVICEERAAVLMLKILRSAVQNLLVWATRRFRFVNPWHRTRENSQEFPLSGCVLYYICGYSVPGNIINVEF